MLLNEEVKISCYSRSLFTGKLSQKWGQVHPACLISTTWLCSMMNVLVLRVTYAGGGKNVSSVDTSKLHPEAQMV